ncbi:hypothetical protein ACLK19_10890 [Escherichia coli]
MNKSLVAVGVIVVRRSLDRRRMVYRQEEFENPSREHGRAGERATQTDSS